VSNRDSVLIDTGDEDTPHLVGHNLRSHIQDLESRMRKAAADLEFETAARLRDEIRKLESDELGLPDHQKRAPVIGNSTEGKPWHPQDEVREAATDQDGAAGAGRLSQNRVFVSAAPAFVLRSRSNPAVGRLGRTRLA
jgi:excinuclease ABC subunit B